MSALEQYFMEREAADRLREAHEFAARERMIRPAGTAFALAGKLRWVVLGSAVIALAIMILVI